MMIIKMVMLMVHLSISRVSSAYLWLYLCKVYLPYQHLAVGLKPVDIEKPKTHGGNTANLSLKSASLYVLC